MKSKDPTKSAIAHSLSSMTRIAPWDVLSDSTKMKEFLAQPNTYVNDSRGRFFILLPDGSYRRVDNILKEMQSE